MRFVMTNLLAALCLVGMLSTEGMAQTTISTPDPRTIKLRIAVSDNFKKFSNWRDDLKLMMGYASSVLQQGTGIILDYDLEKDVKTWNVNVSEAALLSGTRRQLTDDLEKAVPTKKEVDMVLGIHPHPANTDVGGRSQLLGQYPWLRPMLMHSDAYPELKKQKAVIVDPEQKNKFEDTVRDQLLWQNAFIIVHEFLHAFGAVHMTRETSIMNQKAVEPGSKFLERFFGDSEIDLGRPVIRDILTATRTMDFNAGCNRLSDEELSKYLVAVETHKEQLDPAEVAKQVRPVTGLYRQLAQRHLRAGEFAETTTCLEKLAIVRKYDPEALTPQLLDETTGHLTKIFGNTNPSENTKRAMLSTCIERIKKLY